MVKKLLSGSWRKPVLQSCTLSPAGVAGAPGDMLVCSPPSRGVWVCFSALLSLINGRGFRSEQVWEGFLRLPPHGLATTKDLAEGKSTWGHGLSQAPAGAHLRTPLQFSRGPPVSSSA